MRQTTRLKVNLAKLGDNFNSLKELAPKNKIIFMIKANAYGHGLQQVATFVSQNALCDQLGVASLGEAITIRRYCPEISQPILVFSDWAMNSESVEAFTQLGITPVIHSLKMLDFVFSHQELKYLPLVIKLDTGMNRLGISLSEMESLINKLKAQNRLEISHLMTHFSSSFYTLKNNDKTFRQYQDFTKAKQELQTAGITVCDSSCANSGAIEQGFALEESYIRPGLMLYGPSSLLERNVSQWRGVCISQLETSIVEIKAIKKGTPIGYGGHVIHEDGTLLICALGYGDGFLTYYSGLNLQVNGVDLKVVGRINMDLTCFFVSGEKGSGFSVGEIIQLWGHERSELEDFAAQVKSIPYQVLTAFGPRVSRTYYFN